MHLHTLGKLPTPEANSMDCSITAQYCLLLFTKSDMVQLQPGGGR